MVGYPANVMAGGEVGRAASWAAIAKQSARSQSLGLLLAAHEAADGIAMGVGADAAPSMLSNLLQGTNMELQHWARSRKADF